MHELGAGAEGSWLREPLQSTSSFNDASTNSTDTEGGVARSIVHMQYTAGLTELRHRLESLVATVRQMEEEAQDDDRDSAANLINGIQLAGGGRVHLTSRAGMD